MKSEEKDKKVKQMIIAQCAANISEKRLEQAAIEICELSEEAIEEIYLQFDTIYAYNNYLRKIIYKALEVEYV